MKSPSLQQFDPKRTEHQTVNRTEQIRTALEQTMLMQVPRLFSKGNPKSTTHVQKVANNNNIIVIFAMNLHSTLTARAMMLRKKWTPG
jgi:hypothetical protein